MLPSQNDYGKLHICTTEIIEILIATREFCKNRYVYDADITVSNETGHYKRVYFKYLK